MHGHSALYMSQISLMIMISSLLRPLEVYVKDSDSSTQSLSLSPRLRGPRNAKALG